MIQDRPTTPQPEAWWTTVMDPLRQIGERVADFFAPRADAAGTVESYEINVELPGVAESDIDVSLHNGVLTIKGEKKFEREETGKTYYFSERRYGSFQRSFRVPEDVDADQISADFQNGVLTIKVPKTTPAAEKVQSIPINAD